MNNAKNNLLNIELILASFGVNLDIDEENLKYAFNEKVSECQMFLYLLLMVDEKDPEYQECEDKFMTSYSKLDEDEKEYVRNDFKKIMEQQDLNKKKER